MKLFDELAEWWPNIAGPDEYRDEAVFFGRLLRKSVTPRPRTLLDLGSGSGNNAFHLKGDFDMTCVDLSPHMQAVSRKVNPECAHVQADIRTLRLGKTFDAVFVHDVVAHMTTARDLLAVMKTAYVHCRPGGAALFVPDGPEGHDRPGRFRIPPQRLTRPRPHGARAPEARPVRARGMVGDAAEGRLHPIGRERQDDQGRLLGPAPS
ncbi:MAG: class I SAM-dependent methyltransferase [Chloroflexi bacterium]|nr:MAG: class I SAM-dependent methyltransferase [Chloroflexota bacterium]